MGSDKTGTKTAEPPWFSIALAAAALLVIVVLLFLPEQKRPLLPLEYSSADVRTALFSHQITGEHPRVAVVTITDASLPTSPIDRGFLADLVRAVDEAGAAAIGLDVFFRRPTDPTKDRQLQDVLRTARAKVVLGAWDEGLEDKAQRAYQRDFLGETGRPVGFINIRIEPDGIVRYAAEPFSKEYPDSFALQIARTANPAIEASYGRIAWLRRVDTQIPLASLVNFNSTSPFVERTAVDLLQGDKQANAKALAGKVVLIGINLAINDQWRTPLTSRDERETTAGVLIHAQYVAQLLDGRTVKELGSRDGRLLLLGLAFAGGFAGWRFRYRRFDFLSWGVATVLLMGIDAMVFKALHVILPYMPSLLAWFCGVTAGHHLGFIQDWVKRNS